MMQPAQEPSLNKAIDLIRSGEPEKAAPLLASLVKAEPENARAWFLLAGCAPDLKKQRFCLERSIALDPDRSGVKLLEGRLGEGRVLTAQDFLDVLDPPARTGQSDFITLSCPTCGGALQVSEEKERYICPPCGQEHLLRLRAGLEPVLENLKGVRQGINRAADELALQRLGEQINRLQQESEANRRNFTRGGQFLLTGGFILVIYFLVLIYSPLLYLGTFLAVVGLCFLLLGLRKSTRLKSAIREKQDEQARTHSKP